jgi:TolB protein
VDVNADVQVMGISVSSSSTELQNLAMQAFNAHGRYRLLASGGAYSLSFAPAGASAVTVTIARGGSTMHTQTVSGTSLRNALLRAADVAVTKTSGLRGWFAGKIAFVGERTGKTEIYTSDLFFGELVKWTSDGKQVMGPRWSPDGSKIVYTSYRTSFPDIYQIEFATRRISLLASFKGTNSGGRFSPDGSRLAMVLSGEGNPEVYVGNASARQLRRLTTNQSVEASPTFSPDGSRVLYVSDSAGGPQLYTIPVNGGSPTRLATNISKYCAEPDWSAADPSKIVFTAGMGRGYQTAVFDSKTGASKFVTKAPTDAIEPVWLADGRHVICTYRAANSKVLYIVDTESGKATRLSPAAMGNAGNASYLAP